MFVASQSWYIIVASRVKTSQFMESHQNEALENAKRILGEDCWAQTGDASASAASDWLTVQRGRDLFLPGWGGFDVPEAFDACQAAGVTGIPSVAELRSLSNYVSAISLLLSLSNRQNKVGTHMQCPHAEVENACPKTRPPKQRPSAAPELQA